MISPEVLRRFPLFAGLDSGAYKSLAMAGSEVAIKAGDTLFFEGSQADALYLVLDGSVELSINLDEAGERRDDITTVTQGQMIGWSALVEPYVYTLNAAAEADARLVRLDAAPIRQLMDENPLMGYVLMKHLAKAIGERLTNLRVQFVSMVKT